jgi:NAD dependent epimerase/dehydratase family enzyme
MGRAMIGCSMNMPTAERGFSELVGLIEWVMINGKVSGPMNAVAPNPATMNEFCRTLGEVLNRPT